MADYLFRCSSIGMLMGEPKSIDKALITEDVRAIQKKRVDKRTEGEIQLLEHLKAQTLSETAKTYIRGLAAQEIFGVDFEISGKALEKGIEVEPDGIALFNRVRGLALTKNTERRKSRFWTGECDLFHAPGRRGFDLKCSWSIQTFPITTEACEDSIYEYQMRGYMALWDADSWEVVYALVNTPERLIGYESPALHFVDHIPPHQRITTWLVTRDPKVEAAMEAKAVQARAYMQQVIEEFDRTHADPAEIAAMAAAGHSTPWEEPKAPAAAPSTPARAPKPVAEALASLDDF